VKINLLNVYDIILRNWYPTYMDSDSAIVRKLVKINRLEKANAKAQRDASEEYWKLINKSK